MFVIVIGAGPAGLASAACAKNAGADVTILERTDRIATSWHGHYDRLHLHTVKGRSGLPHLPMPGDFPKFPSRAQMVAYLDAYAAEFSLKPEFQINVQTVCQRGDKWDVSHDRGCDHADAVIFATGLNGTPNRVELLGEQTFDGIILHSSDYQSGDVFSGKNVLVVGFGNSGGDIALDLVEAGAHVSLSVRGPVNILPHDLFGIPITSLGGLRKILPYKWADALTAPVLRAKIGRPESYGLQSAGKGPAAQVIEDGRVPLIDIGTLAAIRAGQISVRPGIDLVDESRVRFADGTGGEFDAIILATGYRTDLRDVLPDLHQVLDDTGAPLISGAPGTVRGLYFCSYKASADGQLRQTGIEARAIAQDIKQDIMRN